MQKEAKKLYFLYKEKGNIDIQGLSKAGIQCASCYNRNMIRNLIFDINCKNASVTLGRNNIIEHMGRHEEKGDGKSEYVVIMPYAKVVKEM